METRTPTIRSTFNRATLIVGIMFTVTFAACESKDAEPEQAKDIPLTKSHDPATRPEANPKRATQKSFKGMELYSWKPKDQDWHFNLLAGTNRIKPLDMMTDPTTAIIGCDALKTQLSRLAVGEYVSWSHVGDQPVPVKIAEVITQHSKNISINLYRK